MARIFDYITQDHIQQFRFKLLFKELSRDLLTQPQPHFNRRRGQGEPSLTLALLD